ncbi:MAG: ATP-binding protein [Oscillospiraceae bacterium]|nr:ATP-binding protein [Oscillospiraceae bacterium]
MGAVTELCSEVSALAVFRGLYRLKTFSSIVTMLKDPAPENIGIVAKNLYRHNANISEYIAKAVTEDENSVLRRLARHESLPTEMERAMDAELDILQRLSQVTSDAMRGEYKGYLPGWATSDIDLHALYRQRIDELFTKGYGIYSKYTAFMLKNGSIVPVSSPDRQRLSELHSYEIQRQKVIDNTLALINGKPAANCLLYGDAGTGKSSTVKAVVNEFAPQGLRLIEIKKNELCELPFIMDSISQNPLKFIIFIDDLSFSADDEDFGMLKAALEGSVSSKADNAVIYATSNRRHLLREKFADRSGDDVHAGDTRQEQASLSERFGLKVTFLKPDKQVYLEIVEHLAAQYGIDMPTEELLAGAESYALRRSGRSGRAARHYVESLVAVK